MSQLRKIILSEDEWNCVIYCMDTLRETYPAWHNYNKRVSNVKHKIEKQREYKQDNMFDAQGKLLPKEETMTGVASYHDIKKTGVDD